MRHPLLRITTLLLLVAGGFAVIIASRASGPSRAAPAPKAEAADVIGYPRGPWWRGDVNQTLLGVAHILISHKDAIAQDSMLAVPGERNKRSRDQARKLAMELRTKLLHDPKIFAELARQFSDDAGTAPLGGVIGEAFAPDLPGPMVDALGNLSAGAISRVFETRLGFHIIQRLPVQPELRLDGSEIVIGYVGSATWLRPDHQLSRSRAEAKALADRLYAMLIHDPSAFERLARDESDSVDALSGGDYGQWSTYTRGREPTMLYVLRGLHAGEISNVLDTSRGFRILRRDSDKDRGKYAFTTISVAYDSPASFARVRSVAAATEIAERVSAELHKHPGHFDDLRARYCDPGRCDRPVLTLHGGESQFVPLVARMKTMRIGEVTADPVPTMYGFLFGRREDEARTPEYVPPAINFELPRPAPLSLETATASEIQWYLGQLRQAAAPKLGLTPQQAEQFNSMMENLATSLAAAKPEERAHVAADLNVEMAKLLGPKASIQLAKIHEGLLLSLSGDVVAQR